MGKNKIQLQYIEDFDKRKVTFSKRKDGLLKKASELAILSGCKMSLMFCFNNQMYSLQNTLDLRQGVSPEFRPELDSTSIHMLSPYDYLRGEEQDKEDKKSSKIEESKDGKKRRKKKQKDQKPTNKKETVAFKTLRDSFPVIRDSHSLPDVFRQNRKLKIETENNQENQNSEKERQFEEKLNSLIQVLDLLDSQWSCRDTSIDQLSANVSSIYLLKALLEDPFQEIGGLELTESSENKHYNEFLDARKQVVDSLCSFLPDIHHLGNAITQSEKINSEFLKAKDSLSVQIKTPAQEMSQQMEVIEDFPLKWNPGLTYFNLFAEIKKKVKKTIEPCFDSLGNLAVEIPRESLKSKILSFLMIYSPDVFVRGENTQKEEASFEEQSSMKTLSPEKKKAKRTQLIQKRKSFKQVQKLKSLKRRNMQESEKSGLLKETGISKPIKKKSKLNVREENKGKGAF